jgi:hypothetical protein
VSVEIQATGPVPRPLVKAVEALADLLKLPAGWNSYQSKPIAPQNVLHAIRLLAELIRPQTPAPAVVPRVQGGIQLEWHTGTIDIEVYVDSPEQVNFFAEHVESGESTEGSLIGREDVLKAWVQRISGK